VAKYLILGTIIITGIWIYSQSSLQISYHFADTITPLPAITISTSSPEPNTKILIPDVPFTSQAPFGNWSDDRQQDGCEEASSLMAVSWARGTSFTPNEALNTILNASKYELENYSEYRDISGRDTVERIIKGYFGYTDVQFRGDITPADIVKELHNGNLVITPMNGQLLNNPNFTGAGPERHMLVVRGYDPQKREFITNDPGTRKGELYRYPESVLFSAIRDYHTGYHVPIKDIKKNMIVVSPIPR